MAFRSKTFGRKCALCWFGKVKSCTFSVSERSNNMSTCGSVRIVVILVMGAKEMVK